VGNQVVRLEHKTDGMVAVGVPVRVLIFFGRLAPDDQIAAVIAVEAADDVQQRGFARARRAEHRHKLAFAEIDGDFVQRLLGQFPRPICFRDAFQLQHCPRLFYPN